MFSKIPPKFQCEQSLFGWELVAVEVLKGLAKGTTMRYYVSNHIGTS